MQLKPCAVPAGDHNETDMKFTLSPKILCVLASFSLAFVVSGYSQGKSGDGKAPSKTALKKYDADKDGKLSGEEKANEAKGKAEAKEKREATKKSALEKYDANGNGKLDPEEREKMKADHTAELEAKKAEKAAKKAEQEAKKTKMQAEREEKKATKEKKEKKSKN